MKFAKIPELDRRVDIHRRHRRRLARAGFVMRARQQTRSDAAS
jgi:hypothetical protein